MQINKEIIRNVNEGFATDDTEKILSHLADDVRWIMPGAFSHVGKEAFRKEIIVGAPSILSLTIKNELAEGDCVVIEGEVQCRRKDGGIFDAFFVDIYRLEDGKIKEMRSYVIEKK